MSSALLVIFPSFTASHFLVQLHLVSRGKTTQEWDEEVPDDIVGRMGWGNPKNLRKVPVLALRAINQKFLQNSPQPLFLLLFPPILLLITTLISISGSHSSLCTENPARFLPSHHLFNMQIPPKTSLPRYWPQEMIYSSEIAAFLSGPSLKELAGICTVAMALSPHFWVCWEIRLS